MILRFLLLVSTASAFVATAPSPRLSTRAFGIGEWREGASEGLIANHPATKVRELPILPRDSTQILLQGQTTHLQFVDDDEVRLFRQALSKCGGVFGMGLFQTDNGEDVLLDTMPLLEIQDYNVMGGDFGVFCEARVMGKARVHSEVQGQDTAEGQPISVACTEFSDDAVDDSNLEMANKVADMIENLIYDMSDIEESCLDSMPPSELNQDDPSRATRFVEAYQAAIESDRQGYLFKDRSAAKNNRSWRELTALSWAAFSTSNDLAKDETYRINALGMDGVVNRLKLALYWLSDVRFEMEEALNKTE